jgi:hypothetical protein
MAAKTKASGRKKMRCGSSDQLLPPAKNTDSMSSENNIKGMSRERLAREAFVSDICMTSH